MQNILRAAARRALILVLAPAGAVLAQPTITNFAPNPAGVGQSVTLTGTNLTSATALSVNGISVSTASITNNSATSLVFRVPAGAPASGTTSVTTAGGTATSTALAVLAAPGNSLSFDGTSDYVNVLLPVQGNFTIEFWLRTSMASTTSGQWYNGTGLVDGEVSGVVNDFGTSLLGGKLAFGTGNPDYTISSTTTINDGKWHHVAVTRTQASGQLQIYIDAVLETTGTAGNVGLLSAPPRLTFGMLQTAINFYAGQLDEVHFWNTVRSLANIQDSYKNVPAVPQTGLVAYYNFDQGTAGGTNTGVTTLTDLAGTNNGTLNTFTLTGATSNWVESYAMVIPTATTATALTATGFTATWAAPAVGAVTNYYLDVSQVSTFASVVTGSPFTVAAPATSKVLTGLMPSNSYYYRVRADKTSVTGQARPSNTITTTTPSNLSSLSGLTLSAGTLSPAFASGTIGYSFSVSGNVASTTVTPTATQANATIKVNGTAVASGSTSAAVPLVSGSNQISVQVLAQDGTTITTYTVTVTRNCTVNAVAQAVTVTLDANGNAAVTAAQVNNGSTASCGLASGGGLSVAPSTFTCANLGANPVTLTVTDAYGNAKTASATVTVSAAAALATATWTGAVNTDPLNCRNWSYGQLPNATTSAVVPAGLSQYPSLASGTTLTVNGLTIASGTNLAVGSGATLQVNGDWTNNGTATLDGTVVLVGSAATQTIGGSSPSPFTTLTVNKTSGTVQLARDLAIGTALTLTSGTLATTASYRVALGSTATLSETETSYVTGNVAVTRTLAAGTAEQFGGVGLTLTPAAGSVAPGSTPVVRTTGTALTGAGTSQSVQRYYDIQPTTNTGLNVNMAFQYFNHELNSIPAANLTVFKAATTAGPWRPMGQNGNSANTVTKTGITDFSVWTLGNTAQPLPVELTSFTAVAQGPAAVYLAWATASERNNAGFTVERGTDGQVFAAVGTVAGAGPGPSSTPRAYAFVDTRLPAGAALLYYRLRQTDRDGTIAYSPVRVVALNGTVVPPLLLAYPNPTRGTVRVLLLGPVPAAPLRLLDALGRAVRSQPAPAAGTEAVLPLAGLPAGLYVLRCGALSQRLTVE